MLDLNNKYNARVIQTHKTSPLDDVMDEIEQHASVFAQVMIHSELLRVIQVYIQQLTS